MRAEIAAQFLLSFAALCVLMIGAAACAAAVSVAYKAVRWVLF